MPVGSRKAGNVALPLRWRQESVGQSEAPMPIKQKKITIETREVWVIRRPKTEARGANGWCVLCAAEVEFLTADEASRLTGESVREIFRRIELSQLHFLESPAGGILICLPSLMADCFCRQCSNSEPAETAI